MLNDTLRVRPPEGTSTWCERSTRRSRASTTVVRPASAKAASRRVLSSDRHLEIAPFELALAPAREEAPCRSQQGAQWAARDRAHLCPAPVARVGRLPSQARRVPAHHRRPPPERRPRLGQSSLRDQAPLMEARTIGCSERAVGHATAEFRAPKRASALHRPPHRSPAALTLLLRGLIRSLRLAAPQPARQKHDVRSLRAVSKTRPPPVLSLAARAPRHATRVSRLVTTQRRCRSQALAAARGFLRALVGVVEARTSSSLKVAAAEGRRDCCWLHSAAQSERPASHAVRVRDCASRCPSPPART